MHGLVDLIARLITKNEYDLFLFGFLMDLPFNVIFDIYEKDMCLEKKYRKLLWCSFETLGTDCIYYFTEAMKKMDLDFTDVCRLYYSNLFDFCGEYHEVYRRDESNELYAICKMCKLLYTLPNTEQVLREFSLRSCIFPLDFFFVVHNSYDKLTKQEFITRFKSVCIKLVGKIKYNQMFDGFVDF